MDSEKGNSNLFKKYSYLDPGNTTKSRKSRSLKPVVAEYRQIPREEGSSSISKELATALKTPFVKSSPSDQTNKKKDAPAAPPVKVSVQLGGMQYRLTAPTKTEEIYLTQVAKRADRAITELRTNSPHLSTMDLGMLTLINVMDALTQKEKYIKKAEEQFSQYLSNNEIEKNNMLKIKEQNFAMKKEIDRLKAIIDNYENLINGTPPAPLPPVSLPLEELLAFRETLDDEQ